MKFTMWVSLALIGVGVLFAQDGSANDATTTIDESLGRRRIARGAEAVNGSTLERRLRDRSSGSSNSNNSITRNQRDSDVKYQVEEEPSARRRTLDFEDDWFRSILLSSATGSFSMMPLPTASPNQDKPTDAPVAAPSRRPTTPSPIGKPSSRPTPRPTKLPFQFPTRSPTPDPTSSPTPGATTPGPTPNPTRGPTPEPTLDPTGAPTTKVPTGTPSRAPVTGTPTTGRPTVAPTKGPTRVPTRAPTRVPTKDPTIKPTQEPTMTPTRAPTRTPVEGPTGAPVEGPTEAPAEAPTEAPTEAPLNGPSPSPTAQPSTAPTPVATGTPAPSPIVAPTTPEAGGTTAPSPPTDTDEPTAAPTTGPEPGSPTLSPTKLVSAEPTEDPTAAPSPLPTTGPEPGSPTLAPTEFVPTEPTEEPTAAPSPLPTTGPEPGSPTLAPTAFVPTAAPTTPGCVAEVEISCVWAVDNVTDCRNIPIPGACSAYDIDLDSVLRPVPLSTVSMLFEYSPCASSLTLQQQPEEYTCVDQGQPSSTTDLEAQIACFDDEMNVLVDSTFRSGDYVLLQGQNENGDLGDVIRCEISDVISGERLQEMQITTAVLGNFYLSDRYGSFVVESCDALRCVEPVIYTYNITNAQSEPRLITELLRDRDNDIVSLLPLLSDDQLLQEPGESTVVTEGGGLNLCFDGMVNTTIVTETSSDDGPACRGSDDYSILVEVECRIDVDMVCVTESGEPCTSLEIPELGACSEDGLPFQSLRFRYENSTCEVDEPTNTQGDAATCRDLSMPMDRVRVVCKGVTEGSVTVTNESGDADIGEGDTILLTSTSGTLPTAISCEVRGSIDSVTYQVVTFDTSGSIDLSLRDGFGSLLLEACSTESSTLACETTIFLEYFIKNVGTNDVDVIDLARTVGEETEQLLDLLSETTLATGETAEATENIAVDICRIEETCVSSIVQSSGSNWLVCEDEDKVCFGGIDCAIGVEMTCQMVDDGFAGSCEDLQGEQNLQCTCGQCPSGLVFKYTASPCSETAVPGLLSCLDENPLPEEGAFVVVSSMGSELFRGSVDEGDQIEILQDGSCLPEELMIVVSSGESAASSQVVTIDTSCSDSGIALLEMFGAAQFSGYTCEEDSVPHNCFVNAEFEVVATNIGQVDQTLTGFTLTLNDDVTDLLAAIQVRKLLMEPSQSLSAVAPAVLERCVASEYLASSFAQGNDGDCEAIAEISIGPIDAGSPAPTATPGGTPTVAPTVAPTDGSPGTPTQAPVGTPTIAPTDVSPGSPSPTETPVELPVAFPTQAPIEPGTPTQAPSFTSGTPGPTADCILNVQTACTPPPGSDSCEEIRTEPVQCESRPETMTLLYEGGDCDNSFNAQSGPLFQCQDWNGGLPTEAGDPSYVVITDIRGAGLVFYNGWVEVGDFLTLVSPDGGMLEANQNITFYGSNETGPESILQTLTFHSSCSDNPSAQALFLKDRFGAMQVVGYNNVDQGNVSCFTSAEIETSVTVEQNVGGQPITLTSIVSRYSSAPGGDDGIANYTSDVSGDQIASDSDPYDVSLTLDLDLTSRRTYNVFTTVTGTTTDGRECRGSELFQFAAGQAPPPLFPTIAPTLRPTHSLQPSPDPEQTPCELTAFLTCIVIKGGSNTCVGLQDPSDVTCTGEMSPSSLSFQYTGDRCPVNPQNYRCADTELNMGAAREAVFVEVKEGERIIDFGTVRLNDFIVLPGDYGTEAMITLYTVENGDMRGQPLQILNIPTGCNPDDNLTLLNQYGALELTSFTNAASGEQGIEAQIELVYAVENSGFQSTTVDSGLIIDHFDGGPIEVVDAPFDLEAGAVSILFRNEQILNLRLKEQLGRDYTFFLQVTGSAVSNSFDCTDTVQVSF